MTSRGLQPADWAAVAGFLAEALEIAKEVQASHGKLLKEWVRGLEGNPRIAELREKVEDFAVGFPMPGFDTVSL
jgi:glycine hydroxymethyltransferase